MFLSGHAVLMARAWFGAGINDDKLTVSAAIYFQPEPNPAIGAPAQRNQAKVACDLWLLKFILDHRVSVTVTWKRLKQNNHMLV